MTILRTNPLAVVEGVRPATAWPAGEVDPSLRVYTQPAYTTLLDRSILGAFGPRAITTAKGALTSGKILFRRPGPAVKVARAPFAVIPAPVARTPGKPSGTACGG